MRQSVSRKDGLSHNAATMRQGDDDGVLTVIDES